MHITIPVLFFVSVVLSSTCSIAQEVRAASDGAASAPSGLSEAAVAKENSRVFFSETFDDDQLLKRGWYDGEKFEIDAGGRRKWHGPAASHLTIYIEPWNGRLRLAATDIQNKNAAHGLTQGPLRGGYNGTMFDSSEPLFNDDKWHLIEAYFRLNSLDLVRDQPNTDGVVRGWFDGELVIEHKDVVLRSTDFPHMKFHQFLLTPYFGPGLLPQAQTLWVDELAVGLQQEE